MIKEQFKTFNATVTVENVHEYGINPKEFLLNALNDEFAGKCYYGEYIIKVTNITRQNLCLINKTNIDGDAFVDVVFIAHILYIAAGDMLPAVEIKILDQAYLGRYQYSLENIKIAVGVSAIPKREFRIGWFLPVCISQTYKAPMKDTNNVLGSLVCPKYFIDNNKTWRVPEELGKLELGEFLPKIFGGIKAEIEIRSQFDYAFFENLFYARKTTKQDEEASWQTYTGGPVWRGPKAVPIAGKLVSALEFVNQVIKGQSVNMAGVWTRPLEVHRSSPMFMKLPDSTDGAVITSANVMMTEILTEIFEMLTLIRHMSMFYKKEIIEAQRGLWLIMEEMKI
jgi:hypothetical protein